MRRAERILSSFVEYVPLALMLLVLIELRGAPRVILHALGAVLLASRIMHAYGSNPFKGAGLMRFLGSQLTFLVLAVLWVFRGDLNLGAFTVPGWNRLHPALKALDDGTVALLQAKERKEAWMTAQPVKQIKAPLNPVAQGIILRQHRRLADRGREQNATHDAVISIIGRRPTQPLMLG